jgi:hypothetical protein
MDATKHELLEEIKERLKLARTACKEEEAFVFPEALLELPKWIEAYEPFLGKGNSKHQKFWNVVKDLDKARPGLRATKTITDLFERIGKVKPDPLKRLIAYSQSASCPLPEGALIKELADHVFERRVHNLPNIESYFQILYRVQSDAFSRVQPPLAVDRFDKRFLAHCLYLDFFWQYHTWLDRYYESLEMAHDLAMALEEESFMEMLDKVLLSGFFDTESEKWIYINLFNFDKEKIAHRTTQARERKKRQRAKSRNAMA